MLELWLCPSRKQNTARVMQALCEKTVQVVTPALALTKGGPGKSSYFMSYMLYNYAFKQRGKIGLACAIAFVLFLLIGAFTLLLFATSKSWIFYEGGDDK